MKYSSNILLSFLMIIISIQFNANDNGQSTEAWSGRREISRENFVQKVVSVKDRKKDREWEIFRHDERDERAFGFLMRGRIRRGEKFEKSRFITVKKPDGKFHLEKTEEESRRKAAEDAMWVEFAPNRYCLVGDLIVTLAKERCIEEGRAEIAKQKSEQLAKQEKEGRDKAAKQKLEQLAKQKEILFGKTPGTVADQASSIKINYHKPLTLDMPACHAANVSHRNNSGGLLGTAQKSPLEAAFFRNGCLNFNSVKQDLNHGKLDTIYNLIRTGGINPCLLDEKGNNLFKLCSNKEDRSAIKFAYNEYLEEASGIKY